MAIGTAINPNAAGVTHYYTPEQCLRAAEACKEISIILIACEDYERANQYKAQEIWFLDKAQELAEKESLK